MNLKLFGIILLLGLVIVPTMATPQTVLITSSQNWICPTNIFVVQVKMTGGGAGATGGNSTMMGYSGFNSTTLTLTDVSVVPGQSYPITIGAGSLGSLGYSYQPLSNANSYTSIGGITIAFDHSVSGGGGAVFSAPQSPNGGNGYLSVNLATNGQDGYGTSLATKGGTAGIGYGAAGGAGGIGGIGGTGGSGGNGAGGVVEITYDPDYSLVLMAGNVTDAISASPISGASVTVQQLTFSRTLPTDGSGLFSFTSGINTGYSVTETISKSGYYTETFSFVPYVAQVIPQNVALIPTTFDRGANGTISGLIRDQKGSSIPSVTVSMTNTTGGTLSMTTTETGFYYFQNVPRLSTWNAVFSSSGHVNGSATFDMGWW